MKKFLFAFVLLLLGGAAAQAQVTYEDFEGGTADLNWAGLNGTYNGAVANPDKTGANTSDWVGSYTNNPAVDFSFALHNFASALNISELNQFKMKIWSPTAPAKALLKLEGAGGPAVEKIIDITVANKWVEYTFDLSKGASQTNLKTILVSFNSFVLGDNKTYYFDDIRAEKAGICYSDFEGPGGLPWSVGDGTFTANVDNPGPNRINNSAKVGKYVKSDKHSYSLLIANNGATTFDLSVNNQFKLQVYATAPTQVLMKLEGPGTSVERTKNIAVTGAWQEYVFDFSSAATNTKLNTMILFFDPGVETSSDTYYFDNICAVPNECAGAAIDPDMIDDFECNRNATYTGDWDSLSVVKNPNPTGDNNSAKVGKFNDPSGPGTEYSAIVIDYQNPLDLTAKNRFSCKVWAPKTGNLLLKIEGGPNPAAEASIPVTEINKWVEYSADFSSQVGKGHRKLVVFFNAGVNGSPGDVYYIDDIKLAVPTVLAAIEDFQGATPKLGWQALNQNAALHGSFSGPVDNPTPGGSNVSTKVGCYTKGSSQLSTLQGFSATNFDLAGFPQFNLDVLAPTGVTGKVIMQLVSVLQGNKEISADIKTAGQWETLKFDFSAFNAIKDFNEVRLIFAGGTAAPAQKWYFDNLAQSKVTVDICANTIPVPNILDDFECQRNTEYGAGKDQLKVINNPKLTAANGSLKVGEYKDPANEPFAALCALAPNGIDLSLYNHLSLQVWGPAKVPVLFKLEGGTSPAKEIWDTLRTANAWYKFDVDFSSEAGKDHKRICIFLNGGQNGPETVYYLDNIRWSRAGYNGCISDYQTIASSISNFKYFANGKLEAQGLQFSSVDNPNPTGINTSAKVGKFIRASDASTFAGMYADLEAPIDWKGVKTAKAKVLMDHIGNFAFKMEGSETGVDAVEISRPNTKTNAWEELTYNFAAVPDNASYKRLTIFFDLGIDATGQDVTSYFDDIIIGAGTCGTVGVFNPLPLEPMIVSPNPVADNLRVENFQDVAQIAVVDLYGRQVATVFATNDLYTDIDVSRFPAGVYFLNGYNKQGVLLGNAKFVKM